MKRRRSTFLLKAVAIATGVLVLLLVVVASPFIWSAIMHQRQLAAYERAFDGLSHPPNTRAVKRLTAEGLLEGNGNHCDYFVGELRSFDGNRSQLRTYKDQSIPGVGDKAQYIVLEDLVSAQSKPSEEPEILPPESYGDLATWSATNLDPRRHYIVYLFQSMKEPENDINCM